MNHRCKCVKPTFAVLGALCLAAGAARAGVLRVPQDYLHIQPAVNNAAPGDIVLIQSGIWPDTIDIGGKSLTIAAATGHITVPRIRIHDLAEGQVVTLRGVGAAGSKAMFATGPWETALYIEDCAGRVVVEDASFAGNQGENFKLLSGTPLFHPSGHVAVRVTNCLSVAFVRCQFTGGYGASISDEDVDWGTGSGGSGLFMAGADVSLHACTAMAGPGGSVSDTTIVGGGNGGHGAWIESGRLHASDSSFAGKSGGGGDCSFFGCGSGGDGGHGVLVGSSGAGAGAEFQQVACSFSHGSGAPGGSGSTGGGQSGSSGTHGKDIKKEVGASVIDLGVRPSGDFVAGGPAKEGESLHWTWSGKPGELALAWVSPQLEWTLLPDDAGVLLVDRAAPGALEFVAGTIGAGTGELMLSLPVPELGAAVEGLVLHAQGIFLGSHGLSLGPASVIVLLDAGG